jgi:hypothetical protein
MVQFLLAVVFAWGAGATGGWTLNIPPYPWALVLRAPVAMLALNGTLALAWVVLTWGMSGASGDPTPGIPRANTGAGRV